MVQQRATQAERDEVKAHITMAIGQLVPKSHDHLIEALRSYFEDQKVEEISRFVVMEGEGPFRDLVKECALESGKYYVDDCDQVRVKECSAKS